MNDPRPLSGLRVVELAGIGPGPFAGMMLADAGAEVFLVERPGGNPSATSGHDVLFRNRRSIALDLKEPAGVEAFLSIVSTADALIDPFRPGVVERLGVGPQACHERNPRLVFGRITGWGQQGPLAHAAGHDVNYIALTGALHAIGAAGGPPTIPLNLIGDFGGGGMLLAFGILAGVFKARSTGRGCVIDAAMVDGAASLMAMFHGLLASGDFDDRRGVHQLDGGAPFYGVYETADGRYVSIGALESPFFAELCERLALPPQVHSAHAVPERWPELRSALAAAVGCRTRAELDDLLLGTDACYAPVLGLREVADQPHNRERESYLPFAQGVQPAPTPRFDGVPTTLPAPRRAVGADSAEILAKAGYSPERIASLLEDRVVTGPNRAVTGTRNGQA